MSSFSEWQSFRLRVESLVKSVSEILLELRQTLPQELAKLVATDDSMSIDDFIHSSPCKNALSELLC